MPGPYSAGTIFLQVVPSFRDVQNLARKHGNEVGRAWGEGYDKEAGNGLERAMKPTSETRRAAKMLGADSGDEAGRSFSNTLRNQIDKALSRIPKVEVDIDSSPAERKLQEIRAQLASIKDAHANLEIDSGDALRELAVVGAALAQLNGEEVDVDIKVNTRDAIGDITRLATIADTASRDHRIKFDADTAAAVLQIRNLERESRNVASDGNQAANAFRLFSGVLVGMVLLGPTLVPILAALAGGLLALGPAAIGAGAGIGILAVAFSGIGKAVTAMGAVQKNGAKDAATAGKAIANAANGVADAERGLQRAREAAARSAEDAARRVADAQRALGDAERAARDATTQALEDRRRAEISLADAQRASKRAQDDLVDARRKAQQQLEDLALAQRGGSLAERQAVLDVADAKKELDRVNSRPASSARAVEEANIAYQRAVLSLQQIRTENGRLAQEKADADKKGVNGSDLVKTAQQRVLDATNAQIEAQRNLQKANQNVAQTQIQNARNIADAQRGVSDALRDQQRAASDGAQGVADAQRALSRAQQNYTETVKTSADIGSASVRNLKDAMDKLGPSGQRFARFLFGLKGYFYGLRDAIQQGVLPGVQDAMEQIIGKYGPGFKRFATDMGKTIGDLFRYAARVFSDPTFQEFFHTMAQLAPTFLTQFAKITLNILEGLAGIMNAFAPFAKDFGDLLVQLTGKFATWAGSLKDTKGFKDFIGYLHKVMPEVGKFFLNLFDAIKNLFVALAPLGGIVLSVLSGLLGFIGKMNPKVLGAIVTIIVALVLAFQLFNGVMALTNSIALITSGILAAIAGEGIALTLAIGLVVFAIVALVGIFIAAYTQSKTFHDIVNAAFRGVAAAGKFMWEVVLKPIFEAFIAIVTFLWKNVVKPYFTLLAAFWVTTFKIMAGAWNNVLFPILDLFGAMMTALWRDIIRPALGYIRDAWSNTMGALAAVWRNVLRPVFNAIMDAIGETGIVGAFRTAVSAIRSIWDGIRNIAAAPVRFIINTVLNDGLIGGFNWLADRFKTKHIPDIPLPKGLQAAAEGGMIRGNYIGPKADNVLIRANPREFVQQVAAVDYYGPNFMQALNERRIPRSALPGYAAGGIVRPSKYPLGLGYGNTYAGGGFHSGQDFLSPMGGAVFSAMLGTVKKILQLNYSYGHHIIVGHPGGSETLYAHLSRIGVGVGEDVAAGKEIGLSGNTGHSTGPHLHFEVRTPPGGYSNAVNPLPFLAGAHLPEGGDGGGLHLPKWISNPFGYVKNKVTGLLDKMGHSPFIDLIKHMPMLALDEAKDSILGLGGKVVGAVTGVGKKAFDFFNPFGGRGPEGGGPENNGTMLYDNGGMLAPGITQVLNATGRPEPVFSPAQWAALRGNSSGGGGGTIPAVQIGTLVAADANEAVSKIRTSQQDAAAVNGLREISRGF